MQTIVGAFLWSIMWARIRDDDAQQHRAALVATLACSLFLHVSGLVHSFG